MKHTRRLGFLASGIALVLAGSGVWQSRLDYTVEERLRTLLPAPLTSIEPTATSDLSAACNSASSNDGWIIFLVSLNLISDQTPRKYLQSAPEPYGIYVEYDPDEEGLLRLGLGLGPEKWNTALPLRHARRNEQVQIALGVTADEIRVMGNLVDERTNWPAQFRSNWKCDAFAIAGVDQPTSAALDCEACTTRVSYLTGTGRSEFNDIMNSLTNERRYHLFRVFGSLIVLTGITAIAFAARRA